MPESSDEGEDVASQSSVESGEVCLVLCYCYRNFPMQDLVISLD